MVDGSDDCVQEKDSADGILMGRAPKLAVLSGTDTDIGWELVLGSEDDKDAACVSARGERGWCCGEITPCNKNKSINSYDKSCSHIARK